MCPSGVMLTSSVMCASRVSRAEHITSLCALAQYITVPQAQHHCGEAATSLSLSPLKLFEFCRCISALCASFRGCRQIRTGETLEMFTKLWYNESKKGGDIMKKEILNGTRIPYELSVEELSKMLSSPIMKDFSLACEALSYKNDVTAYEAMKPFINDKDKYRRLYILKTIFRHPNAAELVDFLENAISSDDFLFAENGLIVIAEYKIKISDSLLLSVVDKHLPKLYTAIRSLNTLEICEENYTKLTSIFVKAEQCVQKEVIGEVLANNYLPSKSKELFELFSRDKFAKIRLFAVKIAKKYGYDLSVFLSDEDGHVRNLANRI
jgi:hypothetical protein